MFHIRVYFTGINLVTESSTYRNMSSNLLTTKLITLHVHIIVCTLRKILFYYPCIISESTLTTNVTVPFYQPQKMYQRQYNPSPEYASLPPPPPSYAPSQGYGYSSPPPQHPTNQYGSPPLNQPPLVHRNAAPPPPLPRRQNSDKVAKHHTVVWLFASCYDLWAVYFVLRAMKHFVLITK